MSACGIDRAVILAAGLGTRLTWLTASRPKALMLVRGEPIIVHVIRKLISHGIRDIVINTHHHAQALHDALGNGDAFGCRIRFSDEPQLLNSGGGVKQALELLPGSEPSVIWNGDVLADIDLTALAACLPAGGAAVALVPNPAHHLEGDFSLKGQRVTLKDAERFTFAGVSIWHPQLFAGYDEGSSFPLTLPLRTLIASGHCAGLLHRGIWVDLGRPADLIKANHNYSSHL